MMKNQPDATSQDWPRFLAPLYVVVIIYLLAVGSSLVLASLRGTQGQAGNHLVATLLILGSSIAGALYLVYRKPGAQTLHRFFYALSLGLYRRITLPMRPGARAVLLGAWAYCAYAVVFNAFPFLPHSPERAAERLLMGAQQTGEAAFVVNGWDYVRRSATLDTLSCSPDGRCQITWYLPFLPKAPGEWLNSPDSYQELASQPLEVFRADQVFELKRNALGGWSRAGLPRDAKELFTLAYAEQKDPALIAVGGLGLWSSFDALVSPTSVLMIGTSMIVAVISFFLVLKATRLRTGILALVLMGLVVFALSNRPGHRHLYHAAFEKAVLSDSNSAPAL